jgi:hypothetical protein
MQSIHYQTKLSILMQINLRISDDIGAGLWDFSITINHVGEPAPTGT